MESVEIYYVESVEINYVENVENIYVESILMALSILKQFYMYDMNQVLENYELGKPKYKPKLLEQIFKMEEKRAKQLENNKILQQQNLFNNLFLHLVS